MSFVRKSADLTPIVDTVFAVIAKATKADILPVNISFSGRLHFRSHVYVSFGTLIPYADLGIDEEHIATVKNASRLIMDRINELDPMQR